MSRLIPVWIGALAICAASLADDALLPIPLKPDPPFAIDGDLADWNAVPHAGIVESPEQAVFGATAWTGANDCSGRVWIAWRYEHLYLAADVIDDTIAQPNRGIDIWKGDHIELYLDTAPHADPGRAAFGAGQFQIALSAGDHPEIVCYKPEGHALEGTAIAAVKTAQGYAIEAAIPWKALGLETVAEGIPLRAELGISDADGDGQRQETLLTLGSANWEIVRGRMAPAVLAQADGTITGSWGGTTVADTLTLAAGESQTYTASMGPPPGGLRTVLSLEARIDYKVPAGYTPAMRVVVNGTAMDQSRLLNKPLRARSRGGDMYSLSAIDRFSTFYAPDFHGSDDDPHYGLLDGIRSCLFEFDVTDLQGGDDWTIVIENAAGTEIEGALMAQAVELKHMPPRAAAAAKQGPPEGPLDTFVPQAIHETAYTSRSMEDGIMVVQVGGAEYQVESRFSTPDGAWIAESNAYFEWRRDVEQTAEAIIVRDTFENKTGDVLPIIQRHSLPAKFDRVWVAGLEQPNGAGSMHSPDNPTVYGATAHQGIGLIAVGDVARVHASGRVDENGLLLADENLVLPPNKPYTAEWAIIPTDAGDYWAFINAARRLMDANFTIDGGFAFLRSGPLTDEWSDEKFSSFIDFKDVKYTCMTIDYPRYNGYYTHGTSFQRIPLDAYKNGVARRKRLAPETQSLVYFHCFIDTTEDSVERFPDARLLTPDGTQADYGREEDRIFIPLADNSYGPAIAKNVDLILDDIGAHGVYWDEHEYSRLHYHYGEPWDGFSGDIGANNTLTRLKSSVTLITEAWRLALAKRILAQGPLIGNGAPYTKAMAALKFPCFVESGSITHCARAHLYSPIALGDHLTEQSEEDAYRTMIAALDYGCVYHWYNDMTVIPSHHTLTEYIYPITPMELHEGYIVGEERIITRKSGLFGWGDASQHEVHVYDDSGREAADFSAPFVEKDGQTFTELRLAEDWSAVIVRKK